MRNIAFFLSTPSAWFAFFAWPKFSLTSYRMISSLKRQGVLPKTVIDVGANVGQFAVACAKTYPNTTVYSFEPSPESAARLKKNVSKLSTVHVFPMALGERKGEVPFHINSHSHSSSILALGELHRASFPNALETHTVHVPMSTLDCELSSVSMEGPVLLKLDVQGYEPQVLQGATKTLTRVDWVLLEASFRPMYEGEITFIEIVRLMEQRGFDFLRPVAWLLDPKSGEVLQADALFAKRRTPA
jgi:FkbM family methyltransferase